VHELMAMPPSMGIVAYGGAWPLPPRPSPSRDAPPVATGERHHDGSVFQRPQTALRSQSARYAPHAPYNAKKLSQHPRKEAAERLPDAPLVADRATFRLHFPMTRF